MEIGNRVPRNERSVSGRLNPVEKSRSRLRIRLPIQRQIAEWPDGPRLFAHLRDLPGPLRLTDLPDYVHERGFSPGLEWTIRTVS